MRSIIAAMTLGLTLTACELIPGSTPRATSPERMEAFVVMIEGAGCELPQEENDALLDPAGFSDAEASALSQQLLAEGRAEVNDEGNLVLLTDTCV